MAKRVQGCPTPLDREVAALVGRLDAGSAMSHIASYIVERKPGDVHWITVRFIADELFDVAPEAESPAAGG